MQFFPADIFAAAPIQGSTGQTSKGFAGEGLYSYAPAGSGNSSFQEVFANVSAYNHTNNPGVPITMRSNRDDDSYFKSSDYQFLKEKLGSMEVHSRTVDAYFDQIANQVYNPTIGDLHSILNNMNGQGRCTDALSDQEVVAFRTLAERLGFSEEELVDLESMISRGQGLEFLKAVREKMEGMQIELNGDEIALLCRAADLYGDQLNAVTAWWDEFAIDDKLTFSQDIFEKVFGTTIAELDLQRQRLQVLAENLDEAILAMLENKKLQKDSLSADNRGDARTERTELMARLIATMLDDNENDGEETGSHLMDDRDAGKLNRRESIWASTLDKSNKEESRPAMPEQLEDLLPSARQAREQSASANIRQDAFAAPANNSKNIVQPGADQATSSAAQRAAQEFAPRETLAQTQQTFAETMRGQNLEGQNSALNAASQSASAQNSGQNSFGQDSAQDNAEDGSRSARQDLFAQARQNAESQIVTADKSALSAKVQETQGVVFGMFGNAENSSGQAQSAQNAQNAKAQIHNERIFEQVQSGIIKNATDGIKQITLQLDPPELGKLTLSLTVAQGEVKALIRTDSTATTQAVSEQLAQLKQSLEEQGFKVSSLEVETRPQSHAGTDNWSGMQQHNQEREQLEQSRFMRLSRLRAKEGNALAQTMQHMEQPASISASGIHIIA